MKYMTKMFRGLASVSVLVALLLSCYLWFGCAQFAGASGTVGEYNARINSQTNYVNPNAGQVLDSTGTVYNVVDDLWGRVSTDTTKAAQNRTAVNVRVTTATAIPVTVTNSVTVTTGTVTSNDGTNYSTYDDFWQKFSTNIVSGGSNVSNLNVRVATATVIPVLDSNSNTVAAKISSSVVESGSNKTALNVRVTTATPIPTVNSDNQDEFWIHVSTSFVAYPKNNWGTGNISLNAVATGLHVQVKGGTATIVTSWDPAIPADDGFQLDDQWTVPTATAPTVSCTLGLGTTVWVTLDGKRKLK